MGFWYSFIDFKHFTGGSIQRIFGQLKEKESNIQVTPLVYTQSDGSVWRWLTTAVETMKISLLKLLFFYKHVAESISSCNFTLYITLPLVENGINKMFVNRIKCNIHTLRRHSLFISCLTRFPFYFSQFLNIPWLLLPHFVHDSAELFSFFLAFYASSMTFPFLWLFSTVF